MNQTTKILNTLEKFGRMPSSRISNFLGMDYETFKKYSEVLLKEKKVKKIVETNATYWEITEKGKKEVEKNNNDRK